LTALLPGWCAVFCECPVSFCVHEPSPPEIYTLSLHDALPICGTGEARHRHRRSAERRPCTAQQRVAGPLVQRRRLAEGAGRQQQDRKSTRLNSSHVKISYAVFCLKKKNEQQ